MIVRAISGSMNEIVPAGAIVVIGTYGVHRRKDLWGENAEVFDPDNFLPERMQERHYYSYIPFSAGPRSCVGEFGFRFPAISGATSAPLL